MMYLEVDRADAQRPQRARRRAAPRARRRPRRGTRLASDAGADARRRPRRSRDAEGAGPAALVRRRRDDPARLSGRAAGRAAVRRRSASFSIPDDPTDEGGCEGAIRYFEQGGEEPLMAKADRSSTVHRRVPLDLVVVPMREGGQDHRHRRPCRPVDQPGADACRSRRCRCCARRLDAARAGFRLRSRAAIAARRCATRSPRCRATC